MYIVWHMGKTEETYTMAWNYAFKVWVLCVYQSSFVALFYMISKKIWWICKGPISYNNLLF